MNVLRLLLWRWRMKKFRSGMATPEVERRLGPPTRKVRSGNVEIWIYDQGRIKDMLYSIRAAFVDARVSQVYLGMEACEDTNAAKNTSIESADEPFMEHPSGEHENAIAAMEDAIRRLRALPNWELWITFCAQGEDPARLGTYKFAEVNLLQEKLAVGEERLNLTLITEMAKIPTAAFRADGSCYSLASASPHEFALLLDAIFRHHFGIRPFVDEGNDYAVGAEW